MINYRINQAFKTIIGILSFLILLSIITFYFSAEWINNNYQNKSFGEILFSIFVPISGTETKLKISYIKNSLIPAIITTIYLFFLNRYINTNIIENKNYIISWEKLNFKIFRDKYFINLIERKKEFLINININTKKLTIKLKRTLIFTIALIIKILFITNFILTGIRTIKFDEYIKTIDKKTIFKDFIKQNYVNPSTVKITFPDKKQNLIYICVESLESTFFSTNFGGNRKNNILEPLTELTKNNINFSNTNKFGGALPVTYENNTTAGLVAQTLGLPLKIDKKIIDYEYSHKSILNKAVGLGNILEKEGYEQIFILGSDKKFGNKDTLIKSHGNYKIFDYFKAIEEGLINKDYKKGVGIEDSKIFNIAKEKILKLYETNKPFNCTILASNISAPGGYIEENYKRKFENKICDSIFCSSLQIKNFVNWIKEQKFFKDTTIIIVGDCIKSKNKKPTNNKNLYKKTIYNLFINSKAKPLKTKNRIFSLIDIFPSTLASLGAKIEGEKIALGTNLFSNIKTLSEKFSIEKINDEFEKESIHYNFNFLY